MPDNRAIAKRLLDELWNKGNLGVIDQVCSSKFVLHDTHNPADIQGREAFKGFASALRSAFPDMKTMIEDVIAEGDKVVIRWLAPGTQTGDLLGVPATHNRVTFKGIDIYRFKAGEVAEAWTSYNLMSAMQDLGVIPRQITHRAGAGGGAGM